jgi:hypothetical protein
MQPTPAAPPESAAAALMVGDFAQLFGEEIALCVFFFLSAEDLSQAALVNRTWMRIALDPQ